MDSLITSDVTIVGSGISGMCLAICLAKQGITVTLLDHKKLEFNKKDNDGRCYAIAYGSFITLNQANILDKLRNDICPILNIHVSDNNHSSYVHYDHKIVSDNPMGYIIPANSLDNSLLNEIVKYSNIKILEQSVVDNINSNNKEAKIFLKNGHTITSKLIIAADGKNSLIRKLANINYSIHDYKYDAIVCNITHETNHNNLAQEIFLSTGAFASLPLHGGHQSSLVWTEKNNISHLYMKMDEAQIIEHIERRIGKYLGKITAVSNRYSYPLRLIHAKNYYSNRIALISDAAHAIHPLAGQGLNLGIRDIETLSNLIIEQNKKNLDIGDETILRKYNDLRLFDCWSMIGITHTLHYLFLSNNIFVQTARRLGLNIVNNINLLKHSLIKHAMGI